LSLIRVGSIVVFALVVRLSASSLSRVLLRENWTMTRYLAWYSCGVYIAYTASEMALMRLKAARETSKVLRVRIAESCLTLVPCASLLVTMADIRGISTAWGAAELPNARRSDTPAPCQDW